MLSIKVDWSGTDNAKRLKAFLEDSPTKQRRTATIRCSEAQFNQAPNVFASGVKWEKVDEK